MSRHVHTFCDCCGREITNKFQEPKLFVTMVINKNEPCYFCFDCSRILLDTWWKEARKIREEKLIDIKNEEE